MRHSGPFFLTRLLLGLLVSRSFVSTASVSLLIRPSLDHGLDPGDSDLGGVRFWGKAPRFECQCLRGSEFPNERAREHSNHSGQIVCGYIEQVACQSVKPRPTDSKALKCWAKSGSVHCLALALHPHTNDASIRTFSTYKCEHTYIQYIFQILEWHAYKRRTAALGCGQDFPEFEPNPAFGPLRAPSSLVRGIEVQPIVGPQRFEFAGPRAPSRKFVR
jgi:hypothetical protein